MRAPLTMAIAICCLYCTAQQKTHTTLLFEFGTTTLTEDSKQKLATLIQQLQQKLPASISIDGHTDKVGKEAVNKTLSANRAELIAQSVRTALPETISITSNSHASANLLTDKDEEQHLNRRVEIIIYTKPQQTAASATEAPVVELQPFRKDVEEQRFNINLDDTVEITAKEGTYLKIAPGSIQNKQGKIATGWADLIIKEYYQPSDIMLAGLQSISKDALLQSGGMVNMIIVQRGDTMQTKTKKKIVLQMPQLEQSLTNMQVFEMPHNDSSDQWNSTNIPLRIIGGYWDKPSALMLSSIHYESDFYYTNLPIGRGSSDEYYVSAPFSIFRRYGRPYTKKVSSRIVKKDEITLEMNAKLKMRNRGFRLFRKRNIDTTFSIEFKRPFYSAALDGMGWINCDRFYRNNNNIEFAVNTPGFKGMHVMCYFKNLRAFMQAEGAAGQYMVSRVPPDAEVILVAFGKKDDGFYFGKQEFVTGSGKTGIVKIQKVDEKDFEKEIKSL